MKRLFSSLILILFTLSFITLPCPSHATEAGPPDESFTPPFFNGAEISAKIRAEKMAEFKNRSEKIRTEKLEAESKRRWDRKPPHQHSLEDARNMAKEQQQNAPKMLGQEETQTTTQTTEQKAQEAVRAEQERLEQQNDNW